MRGNLTRTVFGALRRGLPLWLVGGNNPRNVEPITQPLGS